MSVINCMIQTIKEDVLDFLKSVWGGRETIFGVLGIVVSVISFLAWMVFATDLCVQRFGKGPMGAFSGMGLTMFPLVILGILYYIYRVYRDCSQKV